MALVGKILFTIVVVTAAPAALLGLPGSVLVFVASLVYALFTGFDPISWPVLGGLAATTVIAEVADNLAQAGLSRRMGAERKTVLAAFVGSFFGAIVLSAAIGPILAAVGMVAGGVGGVLGATVAALVGALVGGFGGAYWYERRLGKSAEEAARAGLGAALGRIVGVIVKLSLTVAMIVFVLIRIYSHS